MKKKLKDNAALICMGLIALALLWTRFDNESEILSLERQLSRCQHTPQAEIYLKDYIAK